MTSRLLYLSMTAALMAATSGCASITRGSTNEVSFTSTPSGAEVETTTGQSCKTPCMMIFDRREEFTAHFTLDGQKQSVDVRTEVAANGIGASAGNILAGGFIGIGIDAATGATLDHFPDPVHVDFAAPAAAKETPAEIEAQPATLDVTS